MFSVSVLQSEHHHNHSGLLVLPTSPLSVTTASMSDIILHSEQLCLLHIDPSTWGLWDLLRKIRGAFVISSMQKYPRFFLGLMGPGLEGMVERHEGLWLEGMPGA